MFANKTKGKQSRFTLVAMGTKCLRKFEFNNLLARDDQLYLFS